MSKLFVDEIVHQSSQGSGTITIGASGETISIPSGASMSGQNYPAFFAYLNSTQSLTNNVAGKVQFDTEIFDTDNCYDNSTNYRFTPTVSGKYSVTLNIRSQCNATDNLLYFGCYLYKNGVFYQASFTDSRGTYKLSYSNTQEINTIVEMNGTTDYLEGYALINVNTQTPTVLGISGGALSSHFCAYRIGT